jgi:DNA-binding HxlR family transcriptional regulator
LQLASYDAGWRSARLFPVDVSPLARALDRVGDRWSLLVVDALLDGPRRFGELSERVDGIAPNILTARLRRLEREGLVVAVPYSRRPLRLSYELTRAGHELADALAQLAAWGASTEGMPAPRHHDLCGTALELRAWCPTCERVVDHAEEADLRWL